MSGVRRYTYLAATTVLGGQDIINLDNLKIPFHASVLVDVVSGLANYAVEFTLDDLIGTPPLSVRWMPTVEFPAGTTTTKAMPINYIVTGVRLNIQSMTGEIRFRVAQGIGIS
jgi:hypothetical protein